MKIKILSTKFLLFLIKMKHKINYTRLFDCIIGFVSGVAIMFMQEYISGHKEQEKIYSEAIILTETGIDNTKKIWSNNLRILNTFFLNYDCLNNDYKNQSFIVDKDSYECKSAYNDFFISYHQSKIYQDLQLLNSLYNKIHPYIYQEYGRPHRGIIEIIKVIEKNTEKHIDILEKLKLLHQPPLDPMYETILSQIGPDIGTYIRKKMKNPIFEEEVLEYFDYENIQKNIIEYDELNRSLDKMRNSM